MNLLAFLIWLACLVVARILYDARVRQRRQRAAMTLAELDAAIAALHAARDAAGLLPPAGDWCGCCGRPCPEDSLWCADCATHVAPVGQPHERTWYATHGGEDCPFSEWEDDGSIAAEGVGPRIPERRHSKARPAYYLTPIDAEAFGVKRKQQT